MFFFLFSKTSEGKAEGQYPPLAELLSNLSNLYWTKRLSTFDNIILYTTYIKFNSFFIEIIICVN